MLGYPSLKVLTDINTKKIRLEDYPFVGVMIGDDAVIRPNSTLYCEVVAGQGLHTGHNTIIGESTTIGDNVLMGMNVTVDGNTIIGNNVSIQCNAYIPANTTIEDYVFIGPCSVLTNDKYPIRVKHDLKGPVLRTGATIGGNATILPGIEIGEGAMVAAGAVVTKDVPPWKLAIGFPARIVDLPDNLNNLNRI